MEGKIVYQGKTKSGLDIIIRYPLFSDAKKMMEYINILSDERTFVRFQGEHMTLEQESEFLHSQIIKISEHKSILLLVFSKQTLIGISGIDAGDKTDRHVGLFHISVAKDFRGQGVGKILMEKTEKEAIENLPGIEILSLGVFACNVKAREMYKKFGYIEEGILPNGIKLENGYDDHIYMYKNVK